MSGFSQRYQLDNTRNILNDGNYKYERNGHGFIGRNNFEEFKKLEKVEIMAIVEKDKKISVSIHSSNGGVEKKIKKTYFGDNIFPVISSFGTFKRMIYSSCDKLYLLTTEPESEKMNSYDITYPNNFEPKNFFCFETKGKFSRYDYYIIQYNDYNKKWEIRLLNGLDVMDVVDDDRRSEDIFRRINLFRFNYSDFIGFERGIEKVLLEDLNDFGDLF